MKRQIKIENLKPLSINATYYGSGSGFVKTQKANEWMHEVFFQMDTEYNAEALTELREYFDPKLHCFSITLEAQYPKEIFMTKKKMISAKTHDITNWEKALVDCLFLKKHHTAPVPYGAPNLNTDDKYIVDMHSKKRPSYDEYPRLIVDIEILELQVIDNVGN